MASVRQTHFMYLYERVGEPLHLGPRGQGKVQVLYDLPSDYLKPYQNHASAELRKLIPPGIEIDIVSVAKTPTPYDLTPVQVVPRYAIFSIFDPVHREAASALKKILMDQKTLDNFFSASSLCRDSVNSQLWLYAFASACISRKDMRGFRIPAFWEIRPDLFLSSKYIRQAHQQATLPETDRGLIIVDRSFSGQDTDHENRLAYFREDLGINTHHWHWHVVFAWDAPRGTRDRKGELFYYMHHDMLARYDTERLANRLNRVIPLDIQGSIKEAYFPKLTLVNSGIQWSGRQENSKTKNVRRVEDSESLFNTVNLADLQLWEARIKDAIDLGFIASATGEKVPLTPERGIDILGDHIEASALSLNSRYYGSLHNMGHMIISFVHDPEFKYREPNGVMGAFETAMRDPVFYRWHRHIDDIFGRYKDTLKPYTHENLVWPGVRVTSIQTKTGNREPNTLSTHWMQSDLDLARGLDFGRSNVNGLGPVWARVTHLFHESFTYNIHAMNDTRGPLTATVRIFMAPTLNEHRIRFHFAQQRTLFFEMDKFTVSLRPGDNLIERRSEDSTVTIPWEQTFRDIEKTVDRVTGGARAICGCGWPNHMLVPKGTKGGMNFDLFVMLTNGDFDRVAKRPRISNEPEKPHCKDSASFCGVLDELYPDTKPMGFPFDRQPRVEENKPIQYLDDFIIPNSNMASVRIKVFHRDVTVIREGGAPQNMRPITSGGAYNEKEMQRMKISGNQESAGDSNPGWVIVNPPRN